MLLHAAGAAKRFLDHPLPAEYLFTEDDVVSDRLHRQVDAILLERERFDLEARSFFFTGV